VVSEVRVLQGLSKVLELVRALAGQALEDRGEGWDGESVWARCEKRVCCSTLTA